MRLLFVNPPIRTHAPPNNVPLGIGYIISYLRKKDHRIECEVLDDNVQRMSLGKLSSWVTSNAKKYDYILIGGLITTFKYQRLFTRMASKYAPVIIGGGLVTSLPEFTEEYIPQASMYITGEGENACVELCKGTIPSDGSIIASNPIKDLDSIPSPAWDCFDMETYLKNPVWGAEAHNSSKIDVRMNMSRSINLISSRGCPFSCNYCYKISGRDYRTRSAHNMFQEAKALVDKYEVTFLGYSDDNMTVDRKRLEKFCDLVKPLNLHWGCHARVDTPKDLWPIMADAGCRYIGFGIESGSNTMLKAMNKGTTAKQSIEAIHAVRKAGMTANPTFIFGYPGECVKTVKETSDLIKKIGAPRPMFNLTAYPGTKVWNDYEMKILQKYGSLYDYVMELEDATKFTYNFTKFGEVQHHKLKEMCEKGEMK